MARDNCMIRVCESGRIKKKTPKEAAVRRKCDVDCFALLLRALLYKEGLRGAQEDDEWENIEGVRLGEGLCALAVLSVAVAQCHPCRCCCWHRTAAPASCSLVRHWR